MPIFIDSKDIKDAFDFYGRSIKEDSVDILVKIALEKNWTAEDLANNLVAYFSSRNSNSDIDKCLCEEFRKYLSKLSKSSAKKNVRLANENVDNSHLIAGEEWLDFYDENLAASYSSTPIRTKSKSPKIEPNICSPTVVESKYSKSFLNTSNTNISFISQNSLSPLVTPSGKYKSRLNPGNILAQYGSEIVLKKQLLCSDLTLEIKQQPTMDGFMNQHIGDVLTATFRNQEKVKQQLMHKYKISDLQSVTNATQESCYIFGKICCDSIGKLNQHSVILEGCNSISSSKSIPVDLSSCTKFSLFPGQLVILKGINPDGKLFYVEEVFEPHVYNAIPKQNVSFSSVIGCGPYSTSDSLDYEPLLDLIRSVNDDVPDICILIGPFVDSTNDHIISGCYQDEYVDIFQRLLLKLETSTPETVRFVIIPSPRDIHHWGVYPQMPFNIAAPRRFSLVGDPCILSINGIKFGVSSVDAVFHLASEEISCGQLSDKISRTICHLIDQGSFLPLDPTPVDMGCVDLVARATMAGMEDCLDVLLVPSDLKVFVKSCRGSLCVNPGRLSKRLTGGSFAHLHVDNGNLSCKVIKI